MLIPWDNFDLLVDQPWGNNTQIDRQIDRQITSSFSFKKKKNRQLNSKNILSVKKRLGFIDRWIDRQIDIQIDIQIYRYIERQIDRYIDRYIDR